MAAAINDDWRRQRFSEQTHRHRASHLRLFAGVMRCAACAKMECAVALGGVAAPLVGDKVEYFMLF